MNIPAARVKAAWLPDMICSYPYRGYWWNCEKFDYITRASLVICTDSGKTDLMARFTHA